MRWKWKRQGGERREESISEVEGRGAWGEDASIRTVHEIRISSVMANVRRNSRPSVEPEPDVSLPLLPTLHIYVYSE